MDLSRVNLVANLDLPRDAATYMHRVGRTGRYGTRGVAVTFVTPAELARLTADLEAVAGGRVRILGWLRVVPILPQHFVILNIRACAQSCPG